MTTREIILTELKRRGALRADELAKPLDLTAMAVRQHLYLLQEEGAVEAISESSGRGRPAKKWQLTKKSDVYFPDTHRELSLEIIDSVRAVLGDEALDQLIDHRSEKQRKAYEDRVSNKSGIKEKVSSLAALRTQEGYMADVVEEDDGSLLLIENHCPICEAAKSCSGLCKKELEIFQGLIPEAKVERTEHILSGARRCAYKITKGT